MTTPAPTTAGARGTRPQLHVVTREKGHRNAARCSLPFAGNVPDPRTNDAMAGLLTRRSSLFGRLPGDFSSGLWAASSRLTVAGTASELHRVPSWPPYRAAPSACIVGKSSRACQLMPFRRLKEQFRNRPAGVQKRNHRGGRIQAKRSDLDIYPAPAKDALSGRARDTSHDARRKDPMNVGNSPTSSTLWSLTAVRRRNVGNRTNPQIG